MTAQERNILRNILVSFKTSVAKPLQETHREVWSALNLTDVTAIHVFAPLVHLIVSSLHHSHKRHRDLFVFSEVIINQLVVAFEGLCSK